MTTLLFHVDAFTRAPFRGNPAAVMLLDEMRDDEFLQSVAREMNVSETAFAMPMSEGVYALRWFTPTVEVPLCGHATLATAAVLFAQELVKEVVHFETVSGRLTVERSGQAFAMSLPAPNDFQLVDLASIQPILSAAGLAAEDTLFCPTLEKLLVRVASEADVLACQPDFAKLLRAPNELGVKGLVVTSEATPGKMAPHFVSRYFGPWVGIDEDPVTGSAHAFLGPYWGKQLGRTKLLAAQRSARGGDLGVELRDDRVILTGSCVVLSRGVWTA
jgi:PhzF family phenazine biosynthesis protein